MTEKHIPEPYRILLAAMLDADPGSEWTTDTWHDQAAHAQLESGEKVRAQELAEQDGYIVRVTARVGNRVLGQTVPSMVPTRKRGRIALYVRTSKPLPDQILHGRADQRTEVDGQVDLLEAVGS